MVIFLNQLSCIFVKLFESCLVVIFICIYSTGYFFVCVLFWTFEMSSNPLVEYSLQNYSLLVVDRAILHYYAISLEYSFKTTLSFIVIIYGTIYCPVKFVVVAGLVASFSCWELQTSLPFNRFLLSIYNSFYPLFKSYGHMSHKI